MTRSEFTRRFSHIFPNAPHSFWFCFLFPTVIFLVLFLLPYHPILPHHSDPLSDGSSCPPLEWAVLTDHCRVTYSDSDARWILCAPPSPADSDWVAQMLFTSPTPSFEYDVWATDAVLADFRYSAVFSDRKIPHYPGFSCTKASSSSLWCTLRGAPYRAYTVLSWCHATPQLATPTLRFEFFQPSGFNVRYSAIARFGLLVLLGGILCALGYWLRPGGPVLRAQRWPRWLSVSLMAMSGGLASGIVFALRPPDFGGREQLIPGNIPINIASTTLLVTLVGPIGDFCRRRYHGMSGSRQTFVLVLVVFSIAALISVYGALAFKVLHPDVKLIHFKFRYYIYFFTALWLVLVTLAPSEWAAYSRRLSGSLPTTPNRALTLFFSGLVIAITVNFVAIAMGELGQVMGLQGLNRGFYKPASAWGLLISVLPAYFALCTAVVLGEERPRWIQDVSLSLSRFYGHPMAVLPRKKAQLARKIVQNLVTHHHVRKGFDTDLRFISPISGGCLAILQGVAANDVDIEQLSMELPMPSPALTLRLEQIQQDLLEIQKNAPRIDLNSPLVFVDHVNRTGVVGHLRLRCTPHAAAPTTEVALEVSCNGLPLSRTSPLFRQVQSLLMRVCALLGPSRSGMLPFSGTQVDVDFEYPANHPTESFAGESYELTLALLLTQAATGSKPALTWVATGRLHPTGEELQSVSEVYQKWETVRTLKDRVFVISADDAPTLKAPEVVLVSDKEPTRPKTIRRKLAKHLRRGQPAVLACPTLSAALEVLYPRVHFDT